MVIFFDKVKLYSVGDFLYNAVRLILIIKVFYS